MKKAIVIVLLSVVAQVAGAVGIRVGPDCNILLTDSNPAGTVDSATLRWGSTPGDRTGGLFVITPAANTTCSVAGITDPGQYHIAATVTAGGIESDESNEVPFELPPTAPTLDVQP